jgi:hypothetical protein
MLAVRTYGRHDGSQNKSYEMSFFQHFRQPGNNV